MNTRNTNRGPRHMKQSQAQEYWNHLKNHLWMVRYVHPPTHEVMFGEEESMNQIKERGHTVLVTGGGVKKAEVETVEPITWEEFLRQYKINLLDDSEGNTNV